MRWLSRPSCPSSQSLKLPTFCRRNPLLIRRLTCQFRRGTLPHSVPSRPPIIKRRLPGLAAKIGHATRNKLAAIFSALVITMGVWMSTNAWASLTQNGGFPALSSVLVVPGVLVLAFLAPFSRKDLVAMWRKLQVSPSRPFAAI